MPIAAILLIAAPFLAVQWFLSLPVVTQWEIGAAVAVVAALVVRGMIARARQRRAAATRYRAALVAFRWREDITPTEFERHCADYLNQYGWRTSLTRVSGDQGIDVLAEKRGVRVVLQCKRYSSPVGNKAVQEALAGRAYVRAHAAAVVTNATFTRSAIELAQKTDVRLLHFTDLANADRLFL